VYAVAFVANELSPKLPFAPAWATVRSLEDGLFRLDPLTLTVDCIPGDFVPANAPIRMFANLVTGSDFEAHIQSVEFLDRDRVLATVGRDPYQYSWLPTPGRHELVAKARTREGEIILSERKVIYSGIPAFERAADRSGSLVIEDDDGEVFLTEDTLELGWNAETEVSLSAIRLENIPLSRDARISKAHLLFEAAQSDDRPTALQIRAELLTDDSRPALNNYDLSRQSLTKARIPWEPSAWTKKGAVQQSPDLTPLIQEVISQPQWQPRKAIVFILQGSGRRVVAANPSSNEPRLYVELKD